MNYSSPEFLFTVFSIGIGLFLVARTLKNSFAYDKALTEAVATKPATPSWEPLKSYIGNAPDLYEWAIANGYTVLSSSNKSCQHLMLNNKLMSPFVLVFMSESNQFKIYAYQVMLGKVIPIIDDGSLRNKVAYPIRKSFSDIQKIEKKFNFVPHKIS